MKRILCFVIIILLSGCDERAEQPAVPASVEGQIFSGTVTEIIEVDNYTYLKVESGQGSTWIKAR